MIDKDNYLIELKNLKITETDLNNLRNMVDELSDYWITFEPDNKPADFDPLWKGKEFYSPKFNWGCWLKYPNILEHPQVKEIISRLPSEINVRSCSVMKSSPGFHLKPHQDPRNGSFLIVLTPNASPVYFLESDDTLILEHEYTCPTVINTHVRHGSNNQSDSDRITFQLGIVQPWEDIVRILKSSGLA
jgi:hypothetical protein